MKSNSQATRRDVFRSWRFREKTNEEFKLHVRKEYFDEYFDEQDLDLTSDEEKCMLRSIFDDCICYVCLCRRKFI